MDHGSNQQPRSLPARRTLAEDVYDAVMALLMDGVIEPGQRANIEAIARELDVSPTPVREALVRLESEGLVSKRPLKGYTVVPLLDAHGLGELFDLRLLLEPAAAGLATSRLGDDEWAGLQRTVDEMRESAISAATGEQRFKDYRDFADEDAEFHRLIAEASGNGLLAESILRLRAHTHLYRLFFIHGIADETVAEHTRVLDALRAGDSDAAAEAMRSHIELSRARITARVGAEPETPAD